MLSTKEAADRLHVTDSCIRRMIARGVIKAIRIGKRSWSIDPKDLEGVKVSNAGRPRNG